MYDPDHKEPGRLSPASCVRLLWRPQLYLRSPVAEVVLSIGLPQRIDSERFKQVVSPAEGVWMHHLEIQPVDDLDDEVEQWLDAAADASGSRPSRSGAVLSRLQRRLRP